ncbi:hypothetical protein [Fluviicola taffensis]|uniref:Uncharacterized protein n=1 Tax=Fluviicola taffensis (strain DSM 16823 / NCIMB 13979 / RW262) TaxID=755732 RepID=F2IBR4_FLUTR|nr:hypothetical protein [Fluviicola taffensis]AEA45390.1 hypothetical protein Fluta_3418 [Fluviicola taffensis DSM 16823]
MSENLDTTTTKPQGKGLAVTGFILALVGFMFGWLVYAIITAAAVLAAGMGQKSGMGLGYFWIVLCLAAVIMSAMGMMKLGKTGGKKGLAIAGLVIGIVALIWTVTMHLGVGKAVDAANAKGGEFQKQMEELRMN